MFYDTMLQIGRISHHTCQLSNYTYHETLKQICFERAKQIAGNSKIGLLTSFLVSSWLCYGTWKLTNMFV